MVIGGVVIVALGEDVWLNAQYYREWIKDKISWDVLNLI